MNMVWLVQYIDGEFKIYDSQAKVYEEVAKYIYKMPWEDENEMQDVLIELDNAYLNSNTQMTIDPIFRAFEVQIE